MYRLATGINPNNVKSFTLGGMFSFLFDDNADNVIRPKFDSPEYTKLIQSESGWQRVKDMYTVSEFGELSMEANSIIQATCTAGVVGLILGGVNKSKYAFNSFMDNNQASIFQSNFDAKKKLHDQVFIAFSKGGFYVGWRLALFTACYYGISTTMSVFRGKSSVLEYTTGGLVTGFLYKLPLGFRACFVGGAVGGGLGTVAGGITMLILRCTGTTVEEMRYWQHKFTELRPQGKPAQQTGIENDPTTSLIQTRDKIINQPPGVKNDLASLETNTEK